MLVSRNYERRECPLFLCRYVHVCAHSYECVLFASMYSHVMLNLYEWNLSTLLEYFVLVWSTPLIQVYVCIQIFAWLPVGKFLLSFIYLNVEYKINFHWLDLHQRQNCTTWDVFCCNASQINLILATCHLINAHFIMHT